MLKFYIFFLVIFTFHESIVSNPEDNPSCLASASKGFNLAMHSQKNQTGEWMTKFTVDGEMDNKTDTLILNLIHKIVRCGDRQIFRIEGTISDTQMDNIRQRLIFYHKCGKNIAITNNGRTVQKLNGEDRLNAVAFTIRPLKANELFELKVEKKVHKLGYFMGIGVTTISPYEIDIPEHMNRKGTWMLYHNHVFHDGNFLIKENSQNLDKLQVGERVGIMRSSYGTLHLFINGTNKGQVASNIPELIFGVFEFYGDLAQATLIS